MNDYQAIRAWLAMWPSGSHTHRAYRKEAERFLLWAVQARGKPLSSLTTEDCAAYRAFIGNPDGRWSGGLKLRWSPDWKPFQGPLSPRITTKLAEPTVPIFEVMTAFSLLGLVANLVCLFLLWRHRDDDVNMSSVWECSRNDIASNLSVLIASAGVWFTGSGWPDIAVASCLALLLMWSAARVIAAASTQIKTAKA